MHDFTGSKVVVFILILGTSVNNYGCEKVIPTAVVFTTAYTDVSALTFECEIMLYTYV
jgi:hypothetical protein